LFTIIAAVLPSILFHILVAALDWFAIVDKLLLAALVPLAVNAFALEIGSEIDHSGYFHSSFSLLQI
jgi:hypothetical protein